MALFGALEIVKSQANQEKFAVAFEYLERLVDKNSIEHKRLMSCSLDSCKKVELDDGNFALEQIYNAKERKECFFESHRKYIDIQFILSGEEIIEVSNATLLVVSLAYNEQADLIKYEDIKQASSIVLKAGDAAIFYPQDAHMPCIKATDELKVVKAVVKVKI
ncbi:MAG: YhcH/YjgK/YiaL family protein [Sulfurimonas sp.]|uniref:YhcH/YjgK/YiaL family protein n=1 Tax=Sulfurimonas sp. TaxID=2022749 RepID=UPI002605F6C3|nr:YhcH/YjgK/YiaL family protein [Sulfurimonas sp.]MDD5401189.1 YhcH/YjgK/YiaL family protein [Sulfurimonas sp.]